MDFHAEGIIMTNFLTACLWYESPIHFTGSLADKERFAFKAIVHGFGIKLIGIQTDR